MILVSPLLSFVCVASAPSLLALTLLLLSSIYHLPPKSYINSTNQTKPKSNPAWEGGTFKLMLEFTEDYPNKAPSVRFLTKMFHPNIYNDGQICLDILQNQWSPIYDISAILTSIQSLLCDPNPSSPANSEASRLFQENRREYNRRVKEIVEESWVDES